MSATDLRMKAIILDLDNCISDDLGRWMEADGNRDKYLSYCHLDRFNEENFRIAMDLGALHAGSSDFGIHYHTGRPSFMRDDTLVWLRLHRLDRKMLSLKMRPLGDYSYPDKLKKEMLSYHPREEIVAAFDDHQDTVDMYREAGVVGYRLAIHAAHPYLTSCQKTIRRHFDNGEMLPPKS